MASAVICWSIFSVSILWALKGVTQMQCIMPDEHLYKYKGASSTQSVTGHERLYKYTQYHLYSMHAYQNLTRWPSLLFIIKNTWVSHLCDQTFFCVYIIWIFDNHHVLKLLSLTLILNVGYHFLEFTYIWSLWFST